MKKRILYFPLIIMVVSMIILSNCKKKDDTEDVTKTVPVLTTDSVSGIASSTATCGGNVSSDGGASVTARGVCWSTNQNPTTANSKTSNGTGSGSFTSNITGLYPSTTYYVRAYATNSEGTAYGNQVTFTTLAVAQGTVTDIDGNVYNTVTIGSQVWTKENLRVTHYRNGDPITKVALTSTWNTMTTEAFCWYNNDSTANSQLYGALYNWYAVNDNRKIAPAGWHVPTDAEWTTLENYLGGLTVAGGKLKEAGLTHWASPNTNATNSSGFTALPSGYRYSSGVFDVMTYNALYWTATEQNLYYSKYRYLTYMSEAVTVADNNKKAGQSLRLVKD